MVVADSGHNYRQNTIGKKHLIYRTMPSRTHQLTFQSTVKGRHDPPDSRVRHLWSPSASTYRVKFETRPRLRKDNYPRLLPAGKQ